MGKYEIPLTWILLIGILGYLFTVNSYKNEGSTEAELKKEIKVEDQNLNIERMVDIVIENIDIEADVDTVMEINTDLVEEEETTE